MLKFFRKYNKYILVVGGVLLMVVFVAPQLVQNLGPSPDTMAAAYVGDKKITISDMQNASRELDALENFSPYLRQNLLGIDRQNSAHWLLLTEEAERSGFVGEAGDGVSFIPELAVAYVQGLYLDNMRRSGFTAGVNPDAFINSPQGQDAVAQWTEQFQIARAYAIKRTGGFSEQDFDMMLARVRGIVRMIESHRSAARTSEPRVIKTAKRDLDRAYASYAFIPADLFADDVPDPTPEQLDAFYERFKDTPPGGGDYGIGYLLPARIKLGWLTLNRFAIQSKIDIDPDEVARYYLNNRENHPGDLKTERPAIEAILRDQRTDEVMEEADRIIRGEVNRVVRPLPKKAGYFVLPSNWTEQRPSFETIAQQVASSLRERYGAEIPLPAVTIEDANFYDRFAFRNLSGIGNTTTSYGSLQYTTADYLFQVREIAGPNELGIQVGVPLVDSRTLDGLGNRYYMMILDARKESNPDSMETIREDLLRDYKRLTAYEQLVADAGDYIERAKLESPQAVAQRLNEERSDPNDPLAPRASYFPEESFQRFNPGTIGSPNSGRFLSDNRVNNDDVLDAVLDRAAEIDPLAKGDEIPSELRFLSVPVPQHLGLAVLRIDQVLPLTKERFTFDSTIEANRARVTEYAEATLATEYAPFAFKNIAKRLRFRSVDGSDTPEDDGEEASEQASAG